jgi:hypothetical protein
MSLLYFLFQTKVCLLNIWFADHHDLNKERCIYSTKFKVILRNPKGRSVNLFTSFCIYLKSLVEFKVNHLIFKKVPTVYRRVY